MTVIHIGDGRYVEHEEGALYRVPPTPPPIPQRYLWKRNFKKSEPPPPKYTRPERTGENNPTIRKREALPGFTEFANYTLALSNKYAKKGRKVGAVPGIREHELEKVLKAAHKQVKKDMENIKKANPDLDAMGAEALEGALTVLRAPNNQQAKLAAAKLLLEYTRSKPVAKSEVSVNAAEAWLASLGKDDEENS